MSFSEDRRATARRLATFMIIIGFGLASLAQIAERTSTSIAATVIGVSLIAIGLMLRFESVLRVGEPARSAPASRMVGALSLCAGLAVELIGTGDHARAVLVGALLVVVRIALRIEALVIDRLPGLTRH